MMFPLVTIPTNKRDDMTTIKTIIMASPYEVSMYFVFVTLKLIYSFLVDSLLFSVNELMVALVLRLLWKCLVR